MSPDELENGCYGTCPDCGTEHSLPVGASRDYARSLMANIERLGRLDIDVSVADADPKLRLTSLFPGDRGHMFGVLQCQAPDKSILWLKAFSSLRGGIRFVPGWVSPNISQNDYQRIIDPQEQRIKAVSNRWRLEADPVKKTELARERASRSQSLWNKMKALYVFHNFAGRSASISDLFGTHGVPGGVGECCAPKLLCAAALAGLTPLGLSEFYWGPKTQYDGKTSGTFYPCCEQRCRPLLGFILCGHPTHDNYSDPTSTSRD
jgi:hypothetical protein